MRLLACSMLALCLTVGCGKANKAQLNAVNNVISNLSPASKAAAAQISVANIPAILNALAATGLLNATQTAALTSSNTQSIFQNLLVLIQKGTIPTKLAALNNLISAFAPTASASAGSPNLITQLIGIFNTFGPLVQQLDPQLAPFITLVNEILPIVQNIIVQFGAH